MSGALKRRIFLVAWVIALAVAATIPALAIVRGTVWIGPAAYRADGRLTHPLLAIGSDVWLSKGSNAMVVSLFGSIHVSGVAKDDIAGVEAPIYLHRGSRIERDVVSIGQSVYRAPHVMVSGQVGGEMTPWRGSGSPGETNLLAATWHYSGLSFAAGLALLLICTCIAVAFPWPTVLVANNLYRDLARSLVAGLMGMFLFVFLFVPLGLSLFGLPFAVLLAVAAAAAWLLGLTAAAVTLGRYLARLRRHEAGLLWAVVSGMFGLAVAGAVPWVGSLVVGLAGATGAGSLGLAMVARARSGPIPEPVLGTLNETFGDSDAYVQAGVPSTKTGRKS